MSLCSIVLSALTLVLFVSQANAQDAKGKGKKREAEKVEMKDIPATVVAAAKKEMPNATFTSAEKLSQKKLGTLYTLEGKDGKYQVSIMFTSSGELQRLTKSVERRKKAA
jgi:hypothetical protein